MDFWGEGKLLSRLTEELPFEKTRDGGGLEPRHLPGEPGKGVLGMATFF